MLNNTVITTRLSVEPAHHQTQAFSSVEDLLRFVFAQWQAHLLNQGITLTAVGHRFVYSGLFFMKLRLLIPIRWKI